MEAPIAFDVETHRIKAGMMAPRLVCVSTSDQKRNGKVYDRRQGLSVISDLIRRKKRIVAHHAVYDVGVAAAEDPSLLYDIFCAYDSGAITCTRVREMIIMNALGQLKFEWDDELEQFKKQDFSLARVVLRRLHKNIYPKKNKKSPEARWRLNYHELDGVPISAYPKEAYDYALEDSVYGYDIYEAQDREVYNEAIPGEVGQNQAAWALNLLGTWGVRTDAEAVEKYKFELTSDFEKSIVTCQEYDFRRSNKGDTSRDMKKIQAAIESWYKNAGKKPKRTPKGAIGTDREQLTTTDHPGLLAVADSVKIEKLLKTYIPALERGTVVPMNPSYNVMVETFRTSCSGGQKIDGIPLGMNVQNLPRGGRVRECVIPRPGCVFGFCDYDVLEMRTLAQVCITLFGFSDIADAIKAGRDLHVDFAADMLGLSYKRAFSLYESGDSMLETARQGCKITNYGCGGGMGAEALQKYAKNYGMILDKDQAVKQHRGFRRKWSEMLPYFDYCSRLCEGGEAELVEFVGTGLFRGKVNYTALCNGNFQHLAAIGAKEALYQVTKECYVDAGSPLFGCRPWLFNHDECGIEIPYDDFGPEYAHHAAMRLKEVMIEKMQLRCPDVPIGATVAMCRRWYKGARPTYDTKGRLIPVKPVKKDGKTLWISDR